MEINTREITAFDAPARIRFHVDNPWFTGGAEVQTFSREEMPTTKLRALLQRDKGRDLYDLAHALERFHGLDAARVAALFVRYAEAGGRQISRAQAQQRMFAKLVNPRFVLDMRPLLPGIEAVFSAGLSPWTIRPRKARACRRAISGDQTPVLTDRIPARTPTRPVLDETAAIAR